MVIMPHIPSLPRAMNDFDPDLTHKINELLKQMQDAQVAFTEACAKATALIEDLQSQPPGGSETSGSLMRITDVEVGSEPLAPSAADDHYIDLPFMDPYDCFEEAAPSSAFPVPDRLKGSGALEGLFESDPEPPVETSGPDVEIEYLPNGGYRMTSIPRAQKRGDASNANDQFDGLAS